MRKLDGWLILAGMLLLIAALALTGFNLYDERRAGNVAAETLVFLETQIGTPPGAEPEVAPPGAEPQAATEVEIELEAPIDIPIKIDIPRPVEIPDYVLNPKMEMPVTRYDGQEYIGTLEIPVQGLKLPVISRWSYPRLRIAPCRYEGSAYTNDLVISAHNYATHFGGLKNLREDDVIVFTDVDGNRFRYEVAVKETLQPTDVEGMTDSGWDLTLFTCTLGGSHRIAVRCSLINPHM